MSHILLMARLGWKNLYLNWRHSLATLLAILFGFTAVGMFDGFLAGLSRHIDESYVNRGMLGDFIVERTGAVRHLLEDPWKYSLKLEQQKVIEEFLLSRGEDIEEWARFLVISGLATSGTSSAVFGGVGYDVEKGTKIRGKKWEWNAVAGKPLHLAGGPAMVLGTGLAGRLSCETGDDKTTNRDGTYIPKERRFQCKNPLVVLTSTTENSQINTITLGPVGTMDLQLREYNDRFATIPLESAQRLLDTSAVSRYSILLKLGVDRKQFLRDFREFIARRQLEIEVIPWIEHPVANMAVGSLEILGVFRGLFLCVVMVIAGLSVTNSMMKSVNERIKEIGMLRSMGFRQRDIVMLFGFEGFFLTLSACVFGVIFAACLGVVVTWMGFTFKGGILSSAIPIKIVPSVVSWAITLLLLSIASMVVSVFVARRASKMVVADALRHASQYQ